MTIEIVKHADGTGLLRCTRADGSFTWQKQARHAAHFALHDLTHYAVETVLGYKHAFFGLIADGWDIEDTTGNGNRGELPAEATEVEKIVGLLDTERASGVFMTAEDFNAFAPRALTGDELQTIRDARFQLFRRWSQVQPGGKLELPWI